jgi:hypothetical protein
MGFHKAGHDAVADALAARWPFTQASMRGAEGGGLPSRHQMPSALADEYRAALDAGIVRYTVYSYDTPIAWVLADGTAHVPKHDYSVTTRNHQGLCRAWLRGVTA